MIKLTIASSIVVDVSQLEPQTARRLRSMLTYIPKTSTYGKPKSAKPKPVLLYTESQNRRTMTIPRGALADVRRAITDDGTQIQYEVSGVRSNVGTPCVPDDLAVSLRPYQIDAVRQMTDRVQGVVVMPCGGGKTTTASAALVCSGESGIIVCHTRDILQQWIETIDRVCMTKPEEVTKRNCSALSPGEIRVAMVQTLTKLGRLADPVLQSAGALVMDECHHVPAATWMRLLDRCPARYRWGLTATPERADGLGFALFDLIGPQIFKITTRELIDNGFLMEPTIVPVDSGWMPKHEHYPWTLRCPVCGTSHKITDRGLHAATGTRCRKCRSKIPAGSPTDSGPLLYSRAVSDLSVDPQRVAIVARLVRLAESLDRTVLVLLARKRACHVVAKQIRELGVQCEVATGDINKHARSGMLDSVRGGDCRVIIATQLADEGLDLPTVDCVINASPGRSGGRAKQRVGRSLRRSGKQPVVYEIVDRGEFEGQWMSRMSAYVHEYGRKVIYSAEPVAFADARSILLNAHTSDGSKPATDLLF